MIPRVLALLLPPLLLFAQPFRVRPTPSSYQPPEPAQLVSPAADLAPALEHFSSDRRALGMFHDLSISPARDRALRQFAAAWRAALDRVDFDRLSPHGRSEHILFRNLLAREIHELDLEKKRLDEMEPLIPFAAAIVELREARQRVDPLDPAKAASTLTQLNKQVDELIRWVSRLEAGKFKPSVAMRASRTTAALRDVLRRWFQFYDGYDPLFRWWVAEPFKQTDAALEKYAAALREKLAGLKKDDRDTIVGDPIGRDALLAELKYEFIPYTPEELVAIANREFAWCDTEMLNASRALGYGDDWKRALEHVKTLHMPPGQQPALIRDQALEAIEYMEKHSLVTVPPLARDTWRMEMMSPERQRINPFFTGGEVITVSFPTDGMSHEQKLMSLRGNNIHFSRATVFHEVIPGHFLQRFMNDRYRPYRRVFRTPFWTEGWALYWEMLLWDHGFPQTPENRIGMLFWRMHRCARIIFSLSFHLEKMTAGECVDFLVNRVGHERENALAEVRRSFETDYDPLYQAAYMLGALQFRALNKELTGSGKMTVRDLNDAILKLNSMPVELVRAALSQQPLPKDFTSSWRFYGNPR
jgi:uncharacterized protein (DUF885 family)